MRFITRHICLEFGKTFAFILTSLVAISLIIDIVGRIRMFIYHSASLGQIAAYHGWQLSFFISLMIPASSLLAVLIVFTIMSKNNEIVALKASGVSVFAIVKPLVLFALAIAAINGVINSFIAPYGHSRSKHIVYVEVQKRQDWLTLKQDGIWYKDGDVIYNFASYDPQQEAIKGVSAFAFDENFNIIKRFQAPAAIWQDGRWEVRGITAVDLPTKDFPILSKKASLVLPLKEKPADFVILQRDTSTMTSLQIYRYTQKLQRTGADVSLYLTEIHSRLAFPLVNVLLVIIGAVFSIRFGREGGVARSIGAGLAIGFSYWIVNAFIVFLGRAGFLAPVAAAWGANAIFGVIAFFLSRRVKT